MHASLIDKAETHIREMLQDALLHTEHTLVIYDTFHPLNAILTEGYRRVVPDARFIDFSTLTQEKILAEFELLSPNDLVVQIQSSNFRLNEFRIRIFLFEKGLKVIEHMHLDRLPEQEWETYINALHYDKDFYHHLGHGLKKILESGTQTKVYGKDTVLTYDSPFEEVKLNIGDYSAMKNKGGTFPIGEVFTEAKVLENVSGEARIFAFAGLDHHVKIYDPFKVYIEKGILRAGEDAPQEFHEVIALIEADEPVHVREFGLGLNPAITREHILSDVTSFERISGLHLSLGKKHTVYKKPGFKKERCRYHIDVFIDVEKITVDETPIFTNGTFTV